MSPTVEVEVRRNRHGSVLAYADRDRAARLLEDHRAVIQSLYDLVDRRHGSDGEIVARLAIREDERVVDELELCDRFRRDLDPNRAIALVEDLRYHAGERELVTDGGEDIPNAERVLFDAIEEYYDDSRCGAPVSDVVQEMLTEPYIDVAEVGRVLQDRYFDGTIYQPSETTVARVAADGGEPTSDTLHLSSENGLWIPMELRSFTGQVVFRTPRATIQHFQSGGGSLDAYYPMIDSSHFGNADELSSPQNPKLAPNQVSIKPQGENARVFEVDQ
ncbi:hypothetical protein [Halorubrum cibi]|uniref:Uncharacterized protein n=1 Tax=Halorubrum cibi TaxID=413815 RepID=A0A521DDU0_9EURY|nr:hypothetical protein [Halorubrum cibi]SMO69974.1 hypothetical protein SAMN06264867_106221 [Halorubrum cibi]